MINIQEMEPIQIMLQVFHPEYYQGEVNNAPSDTVPNQSFTAKEAYERGLRNIPTPSCCEPSKMPFDGMEDDVDLDDVSNTPHFDSEMDVEDWRQSLIVQMHSHAASQAAKPKADPEPSPASDSDQVSPQPAH